MRDILFDGWSAALDMEVIDVWVCARIMDSQRLTRRVVRRHSTALREETKRTERNPDVRRERSLYEEAQLGRAERRRLAVGMADAD